MERVCQEKLAEADRVLQEKLAELERVHQEWQAEVERVRQERQAAVDQKVPKKLESEPHQYEVAAGTAADQEAPEDKNF